MDYQLTEGDVIAVPAAAAARLVTSPNGAVAGFRGTLWNKGTTTVYFVWSPTDAEAAAAAATMAASGFDTSEHARKGWVEAGSAIRIPGAAQNFLCACAGVGTGVLMHIADGGH